MPRRSPLRQTLHLGPGRPRGFTLVELMVAIAIALLLMLAINYIFGVTAKTIGAGQALGGTVASNRAMQTVLYNDLQQSVIRSEDAPFFIIRSTRVAAFKDKAEELSDIDYASTPPTTWAQADDRMRTIDFDGNNSEADTGDQVQRNNLTQRNYRQDVMAFFVRNLYPRQTGNDGTYAAEMTSSEAFVWYGHLRQPVDPTNVASTNKNPGAQPAQTTPAVETSQSNPNNFYARQWALGRVAILLRTPDVNGEILSKNGVVQRYHMRPAGATAFNYGPLGQDSVTTDGTTADPPAPSLANTRIQYSRYDLAGTSIDDYRALMRGLILPAVPTAPGGTQLWYREGGLTYRFASFPYPTRPLSTYGAARTVPWLVGGCTSFIVEYAGDFLNQIPAAGPVTGAVLGDYSTPGGTDGQVDYIPVPNGIVGSFDRQVRWYGHPRDTGGITLATRGKPDGTITRQATPATLAPVSVDVLPLRDFLSPTALFATGSAASPSNGTGAAFEKFDGALNSSLYNSPTSPATGTSYICAWQPNGTYRDTTGAIIPDPPRPTMLRVTMTIDDPSGRLPEGQTYEYVIDLP